MTLNKITLLFLIIISFSLNSCVSRYLNRDLGYDERFFYFYTENDDVTFIGDDYNYVFSKDNANKINQLAKPEWKSKLTISRIELEFDHDNNVDGYVLLKVSKSEKRLTANQIEFLVKSGFKKDGEDILWKRLEVAGIRYKKSPGTDYYNHQNLSLFSQEYKTKINYKMGKLRKGTRVALTPAAMVADWIIILFAVVVPIALI